MRVKFLLLLFIGLFVTFDSEIKAEESICEYSKYSQYKKCKNKGLSSVPKYPIKSFHWNGMYVMGPYIIAIDQSAMGNRHQVMVFKAYKDTKLEITSGTKTVGFFGLNTQSKFIISKTYSINPQRIYSLKKNDQLRPWGIGLFNVVYRSYEIKSLDDFGETNTIKFQQIIEGKKDKYDMLGDYLIYASKLNWGEEKSVNLEREKYLKENEKNIEIIKSIILTKNNTLKNCIEVKDTKFPELVQRYERISRTINPLRMKLDLPPSNDLKLICK